MNVLSRPSGKVAAMETTITVGPDVRCIWPPDYRLEQLDGMEPDSRPPSAADVAQHCGFLPLAPNRSNPKARSDFDPFVRVKPECYRWFESCPARQDVRHLRLQPWGCQERLSVRPGSSMERCGLGAAVITMQR
jgi:hypothetical protein